MKTNKLYRNSFLAVVAFVVLLGAPGALSYGPRHLSLDQLDSEAGSIVNWNNRMTPCAGQVIESELLFVERYMHEFIEKMEESLEHLGRNSGIDPDIWIEDAFDSKTGIKRFYAMIYEKAE